MQDRIDEDDILSIAVFLEGRFPLAGPAFFFPLIMKPRNKKARMTAQAIMRAIISVEIDQEVFKDLFLRFSSGKMTQFAEMTDEN
jgi:hypothetical protein